MYKHILIPTDGSELSQKAITYGFGLAKLTNAKVTVLTVTPSYPVTYMEGGAEATRDFAKDTEKHWKEEARKALTKAQEEGRAAGIETDVQVLCGENVSEIILSMAEDKDIDLIVMASHGRTGLARLLLGSETQHVLTASQIPLVILR